MLYSDFFPGIWKAMFLLLTGHHLLAFLNWTQFWNVFGFLLKAKGLATTSLRFSWRYKWDGGNEFIEWWLGMGALCRFQNVREFQEPYLYLRNWGLEMLNTLCRVTQLVIGGPDIQFGTLFTAPCVFFPWMVAPFSPSLAKSLRLAWPQGTRSPYSCWMTWVQCSNPDILMPLFALAYGNWAIWTTGKRGDLSQASRSRNIQVITHPNL